LGIFYPKPVTIASPARRYLPFTEVHLEQVVYFNISRSFPTTYRRRDGKCELFYVRNGTAAKVTAVDSKTLTVQVGVQTELGNATLRLFALLPCKEDCQDMQRSDLLPISDIPLPTDDEIVWPEGRKPSK